MPRVLSLSSVFTALMAVAPEWLLALLLDGNSDTFPSIGELFPVFAAVLQFLKRARNIGVGLLRGLGNTKIGFRTSLVGYWAARAGWAGLAVCGLRRHAAAASCRT